LYFYEYGSASFNHNYSTYPTIYYVFRLNKYNTELGGKYPFNIIQHGQGNIVTILAIQRRFSVAWG